MTEVRYRPASGDDTWRVAVAGGALAALPPTVTDLVAETVWRRVGDGGVEVIIEALTGAFGTSLSAIPDFALAVVERGGVRVVVRGPIEVVVDDGETVSAVSGAGVATWVERHVPGARTVTIVLVDAPGDPAGLPIASGVVPATAVVLAVRDGVDARDVAGAGAGAAPTDAESAPPMEPDGEVAPAAMVDDATSSHDIVTDVTSADTLLPLATMEPAPQPEPQPAPEPEPATAAAPDLAPAAAADATTDVSEFDLVWGATIAKPTAARRAAADAEGSAPASPPAAASAPAPVVAGDHDGETIAVADLRAIRQAERERYESTDGVPPRRPARGRIRLSTGRVVELERPVVVGRRPKSTRTSGSELPTLVAVESPDQDISRSHVEIRTEGEYVLVTDLDTTNGTVLQRGGQEPVRLHPGEPTMVISGDVLDIGDGVTIAFEDLP